MAHVLLVTVPSQGQINPLLHLAKRLVNMGNKVTYAASFHALRKLPIADVDDQEPDGLCFVGFSDGYDEGFDIYSDDVNNYMSEMKARGSKALRDIILSSAKQGRPVTCLVYTVFLQWASQVAQEASIHCVFLWPQAATVLSVYHSYFHGFGDVIDQNVIAGERTHLPGIVTTLSKYDFPSFFLPPTSDMSTQALQMSTQCLNTFKEHLLILDEADRSKTNVLVNTFDALEPDALKALNKYYNLIAIGPLAPSMRLDKPVREDHELCLDWLNSRPKSSVVYIAFGSLLVQQQVQVEEIAKGLLECGRPFLWVMRDKSDAKNEEGDKKSCLQDLENLGKIVPWCSQLEVLAHPSLGCFVTHCGWNSTQESISCGVPLIAFPQWTDQGTNAKLIEDVWKIGVRVTVDEEKGLVESDEIVRCIEKVMDTNGPEANELRENAMKWKLLAEAAVKENGPSDTNLKCFLQ